MANKTISIDELNTKEEIAEYLDTLEELDKRNGKIAHAESDFRTMQRFFLLLIILIIILWLFSMKIVGFMSVPTNDMNPRMDAGDLMMYYRLDKTPEPRDVIVFEKNGTEYVSRVVAMPGDTVEISEADRLVVNGSAQFESDIFYDTPIIEEGKVEYPLTLGEDEYFVLGDAREDSEDSRYFGPVTKNEIKGTVISITRRNQL